MHRHSTLPLSLLCRSTFRAGITSILGFGVALAIRGHYASIKSSLIVGIVLAVLGFSAVVAAALGFGAAASRVSRKWGLIFKAFSITGGVLIAIGYALNQYFVSDERPLCKSMRGLLR
jgi:hypothetical protein